MAGNPSNAALWADADVYVAFLSDTPNPTIPSDADAAFNSDWDLIGLLDGDAGFVESREKDETDHFAWGGILVKTGRRNYKEQHTFTALEWNVTTERLYRPGSDTPGVWKVALRPERVMVALEMREGDVTKRLISYHECEVDVDGDVTRNESDIASIPFRITVYPDGSGNLWTVQDNTPASS